MSQKPKGFAKFLSKFDKALGGELGTSSKITTIYNETPAIIKGYARQYQTTSFHKDFEIPPKSNFVFESKSRDKVNIEFQFYQDTKLGDKYELINLGENLIIKQEGEYLFVVVQKPDQTISEDYYYFKQLEFDSLIQVALSDASFDVAGFIRGTALVDNFRTFPEIGNFVWENLKAVEHLLQLLSLDIFRDVNWETTIRKEKDVGHAVSNIHIPGAHGPDLRTRTTYTEVSTEKRAFGINDSETALKFFYRTTIAGMWGPENFWDGILWNEKTMKSYDSFLYDFASLINRAFSKANWPENFRHFWMRITIALAWAFGGQYSFAYYKNKTLGLFLVDEKDNPKVNRLGRLPDKIIDGEKLDPEKVLEGMKNSLSKLKH
uniref:Uncharacterized protein n=1 Tax=Acrobeloides nanus TaxID=290746 RepID=A0A914C669_9BILA